MFMPVVAASVALMGLSAPARAQINVKQTSVAGRDENRNNLQNVPLSKAECEANVEIIFLIESIPTDRTRLDFWSNGADCNTTEQRSPKTGACEQLDVGNIEINNRARIPELPISAQALFNCEESDRPTFFVLAVNSSNDEVDTNQWGSIELEIDAQAPGAPGGVEGKRGDTEIQVDWATPSGENVHGYTVYVDPAATDCQSELLIAGEAVPADISGLKLTEVNGNASSAVINGSAAGMEYEAKAAVAVVARDIAGNQSAVSNVSCITRTQTFGYWQQYCQGETGNTDCDSSGCAVTPGKPQAPVPAGTLALAGLMMLWMRRRRQA